LAADTSDRPGPRRRRLGQRKAIALLTDAGFVSVSVAIPAGQNTGVVTSQDPTPGTRSDVTGTIKLTVSAND
jgi:beta-lactam-binding protein with PASTA domain